MKKLLTSKAGVTVLEGIIALGLLALVAGGAFGVLLAASRQTSQPDIREEMALAVDKANNLLKAYVGVENTDGDPVPTALRRGLCCQQDGENFCYANPLNTELGITYNIKCMLPPICDKNTSAFTYEVEDSGIPDAEKSKITFNITCNGYEL